MRFDLRQASRSLSRPVIAVVLFLPVLVAPGVARAQYGFTRIADTSATFSGFTGTAGVNVTGTVAFTANLSAGGSGVYLKSGSSAATAIASSTGSTFSSFSGPVALNAFNQATFIGTLKSGDTGVAYQPASGSATILGNSSGAYATFGNAPSINGRGTVAFEATLDAGGAGIYTGAVGTTATAILTTGTTYSAFSDPSLNGRGNVAFYSTLTAGGQSVLLSAGGGTPVTVAQTGTGTGTFSSFLGLPSLNSVGTVAFVGALNGGSSGVYIGTGDGVATAVATTANGFSAFSQAAINSSGFLAFQAVNSATGAAGIFVSDGTNATKIIGVGDALDGSTVTSVTLGRDGWNDSGQVAFFASLANGRVGVYLASMPEPPAAFLGLLGIAISAGGAGIKRLAEQRERKHRA